MDVPHPLDELDHAGLVSRHTMVWPHCEVVVVDTEGCGGGRGGLQGGGEQGELRGEQGEAKGRSLEGNKGRLREELRGEQGEVKGRFRGEQGEVKGRS